jgi:ATP-binding cassette subfamily B (MDR/TAP) protein 1
LDVKPGQYVALVGTSGCGKSTTVALIERFYDPIGGDVLVDGIPVSKYNLSEYRKNISIVTQEPTYLPPFDYSNDSLYQGSIRFNILLGANRDVTQEEIDNAAKDANVLFIFFILSNCRFLNSFKVSPQDMIPS